MKLGTSFGDRFSKVKPPWRHVYSLGRQHGVRFWSLAELDGKERLWLIDACYARKRKRKKIYNFPYNKRSSSFTSQPSWYIASYLVGPVHGTGYNYELTLGDQILSHRSSLAHQVPPQLHQLQTVDWPGHSKMVFQFFRTKSDPYTFCNQKKISASILSMLQEPEDHEKKREEREWHVSYAIFNNSPHVKLLDWVFSYL